MRSSSLSPLGLIPPKEGARSKGREERRSRSKLEQQFLLYARFGHLGEQADHITLSQSDKWLRQAGAMDGLGLTTTDTAIAFRKTSRGSTRLGYPAWLVFLRELAEAKRLVLADLWGRLEQVSHHANFFIFFLYINYTIKK